MSTCFNSPFSLSSWRIARISFLRVKRFVSSSPANQSVGDISVFVLIILRNFIAPNHPGSSYSPFLAVMVMLSSICCAPQALKAAIKTFNENRKSFRTQVFQSHRLHHSLAWEHVRTLAHCRQSFPPLPLQEKRIADSLRAKANSVAATKAAAEDFAKKMRERESALSEAGACTRHEPSSHPVRLGCSVIVPLN